MSDVLHQRDWDDTDLRAHGFKQFDRKKEIIMVRSLPANEAPKIIHTSWGETLIAQAGYFICYAPDGEPQAHLDQYNHWPVHPDIFRKTYQKWADKFEPTPAQQHLLKNGCQPYYKAVKVWAKELDEGVYIQGLEHERPVLVPKKRVLAIGAEGEPYHMGDQTFHDRYEGNLSKQPKRLQGILKRLIDFFTTA